MDLGGGEPIERWRQVPGAPRDPVSARCFPPDDPAFGSLVQQALHDAAMWNGEGVDPRRLEAWLRRLFPRVRVVPRSSLADLGGWTATWYVYRDGHYDTRPAPERWWLDPSLPRVLADSDGRCVDANARALETLGLTDQDIVGRPLSDLLAPEARAYFGTLRALAGDQGSIDTAAVFQRATGERVEVALHLSVDPRTGHRLIVFRQV